MRKDRVQALLMAYLRYPLKEYIRVVADISRSGGLTSEEVCFLQTQLSSAHAWTVIRHAGVQPFAA
jgi:hypothetical protein